MFFHNNFQNIGDGSHQQQQQQQDTQQIGQQGMHHGLPMHHHLGPPPPHFMAPFGLPPFGYPPPFHPSPLPQHHSFDHNPLLSSSSSSSFSILSNSSSMITNPINISQQLLQSQQSQQQQQQQSIIPTLTEIFDDLASRFVLNIPSEELESFERLLFQIEAAHWFYEDFYREEHQTLPKYNLAEFTKVFFNSCPLLQPHQNSVEEICKKFSEYKTRVPVFGCIMLNEDLDKALFVKGFGSSTWGFPKGKVNKDEADHDCAIREVYEETGFDCSAYLNQRHFLEILIKEQKTKLYIVAGVPENTPFKTRTRKEISKIEWIPIDCLPTISKKVGMMYGNNNGNNNNSGYKEKNFYRAFPFFSKLKRWIATRKAKYPRELYPTTPHDSSHKNNSSNNALTSTPITILQHQNSHQNLTTTTITSTPITILQNQTPRSTPTSANTTVTNVNSINSQNSTSKINYSPYPKSPPDSPRDHHQEVFNNHNIIDGIPAPIVILQNQNQIHHLNTNSNNNNDISGVNLTNLFKTTLTSNITKNSNQQQQDEFSYPKIPDTFTSFIFTMESFNVDTLVNCFKCITATTAQKSSSMTQ